MLIAGRERVDRRLDTERERLGAKQDERTDDSPEQHTSRFCYFRWFTLRDDELVADEDKHQDDDDGTDFYNELENLLQEPLESGTPLKRINEGGGTSTGVGAPGSRLPRVGAAATGRRTTQPLRPISGYTGTGFYLSGTTLG